MSEFANLQQALSWLDSHIDYERIAPKRRALPSLEGMYQALEALGQPQRDFRSIHVTGTNGKGSTSAMMSALLVEQGLRVGTYTSPNLHLVNERISINGQMIADTVLCDLLGRLSDAEGAFPTKLTRFELLTLAAFVHFADEAVDVAVVEVGIGGSWDSTNVLGAEVAVITTVSLDHTQVLGDTVEAIATDKAGIISPGATVIVGDLDQALVDRVREIAEGVAAEKVSVFGTDFGVNSNVVAVGGRLLDLYDAQVRYSEVAVPLHGGHQGHNAAVALAAVNAFLGFAIDEDVVDVGFGQVRVPGRLEVLGRNPLTIIDGAHNPAGTRALGDAIEEGFSVEGDKVVIIGMLEGRSAHDVLEPLVPLGIHKVFVVEPQSPRAMAADTLMAAAQAFSLEAVKSVSIDEACAMALEESGDEGLLLVTGSLYVVGPARLILRERFANR